MKPELKKLLYFAVETFIATMVASALLCWERWGLDRWWRSAKDVPIDSIFEFATAILIVMVGTYIWYIFKSFYYKRQKGAHLDHFKPEIFDHLHLLSIVLKNFHQVKLEQIAPPGKADGRYVGRIKKSDHSLSEHDVVFGNAFWEFLDSLDVSLDMFLKHLNSSFLENGFAQLEFVGMHFGDPRACAVNTEVGERIYYERVSGYAPGVKKRATFKSGKMPPILSLISHLSGWCPVTSVLLHLTSKNEWISKKDIPRDCFCISMRNIKRANFDKPSEADKLNYLQERWDDIYIEPPAKWSDLDIGLNVGDLMHFRIEASEGSRHRIIAAEETFAGLKSDVAGGMTKAERAKILDYEDTNIIELVKSKGSQESLTLGDPRHRFVEHLMNCFDAGLASVSLDDIKSKHNARLERYIYYVLPGSTKGRTAAGYFICNSPIRQEVIPELQMLFLPFGLIVIDGMICIHDLHPGPRSSSEIMKQIYRLSNEPEQ